MKEADTSEMVNGGWSNERILEEIAKCEILCANCHRILHWERSMERGKGSACYAKPFYNFDEATVNYKPYVGSHVGLAVPIQNGWGVAFKDYPFAHMNQLSSGLSNFM